MKTKKKTTKKTTAKAKVTAKAKTKTKAKAKTKKPNGLKEKTHIIAVLDKSGSMSVVKDAAMSGFNEFVNAQKAIKGKATMDLVLFSSPEEIRTVYSGKNIQDVELLTPQTYITGGNTALHDAIGQSITDYTTKRTTQTKSEKADKVLVVIITDGEENASVKYRDMDLLKGVIEQRKKENWQFMFLCSTENAVLTGQGLGVSRGNTMKFTNTSAGNAAMYAAVADATTLLRTSSVKSKSYEKLSNNLLAEDDNN